MKGGTRPGAGRKPNTIKHDAKNTVLHIRITPADCATITQHAAMNKESVSDFIRKAIAERCRNMDVAW